MERVNHLILYTRHAELYYAYANRGGDRDERRDWHYQTAMLKAYVAQYPSEPFEIVALENSFHGRTLATAAATGQEKIQKGFEPMPEGFRTATFNDLASVAAAELAEQLEWGLEGEWAGLGGRGRLWGRQLAPGPRRPGAGRGGHWRRGWLSDRESSAVRSPPRLQPRLL